MMHGAGPDCGRRVVGRFGPAKCRSVLYNSCVVNRETEGARRQPAPIVEAFDGNFARLLIGADWIPRAEGYERTFPDASSIEETRRVYALNAPFGNDFPGTDATRWEYALFWARATNNLLAMHSIQMDNRRAVALYDDAAGILQSLVNQVGFPRDLGLKRLAVLQYNTARALFVLAFQVREADRAIGIANSRSMTESAKATIRLRSERGEDVALVETELGRLDESLWWY